MFANIFKKKEKAPTAEEALQKLRETEDTLRKKQQFLDTKSQAELANAKKYGTANKRLALQSLKRHKQIVQNLQQIDGILNKIEQQKDSLENASVNAEVLQVLSNSAKAFKSAHNNMDVDKVHDLMDELQEQQDIAEEIAQAISSPTGNLVDEDELLSELEALEQEDIAEKLQAVEPMPAPRLPSVPTTELPTVSRSKAKEDDEMAQLQAWAES